MMKIAVLITCHNRKKKTIACLDTVQATVQPYLDRMSLHLFLTDDGCTDGTPEAIREQNYHFPIEILQGDGTLFWNGGMIKAWEAAISAGGFDGYLWLNDDATVLPELWPDLLTVDEYSIQQFGKRGIYIGSTKDRNTGEFTYGGFCYTNKWTLSDKYVIPDGEHIQACEAGHGNITYVAKEVVDSRGIFDKRYWHGGSDHDYTYLSHKAGIPILVLPRYSGFCENDHLIRSFTMLPLPQRIKQFWLPKGYNMHNALLFNWRCFPYRTVFVLMSGIAKCIFPKMAYQQYEKNRGTNK